MRKIIVVFDPKEEKSYEYEPRPQFYDVTRVIQRLRQHEKKDMEIDTWRETLIYRIVSSAKFYS